ncbi:hypothetical protein E3U43_009425 [Larimichthys crocea]|uniref:Uncharacterized protein n=1 Tax=Larimichthys crocea TaxID=215358 RepID=A0ACD3QCM0_LARCR|nr:hypothetical protein E3U43_009425 [Larimichthys crocea]
MTCIGSAEIHSIVVRVPSRVQPSVPTRYNNGDTRGPAETSCVQYAGMDKRPSTDSRSKQTRLFLTPCSKRVRSVMIIVGSSSSSSSRLQSDRLAEVVCPSQASL